MTSITTQYGSHIPGPATRAFKAMQQYAFGQCGRSRFKGYRQLDSVEGKTNTSGIRWQDDGVVLEVGGTSSSHRLGRPGGGARSEPALS